MTSPDPTISVFHIILAFVTVAGLLGLLGLGLKFITARGMKLSNAMRGNKRMEIVETLPLDIRRRLVIVRCDDREHLILLGVSQDIVVAENRRQGTPPC